jgi:hypothetical protein
MRAYLPCCSMFLPTNVYISQLRYLASEEGCRLNFVHSATSSQSEPSRTIDFTANMLTLPVATLTSILLALASSTNAAPLDAHPSLLKRATGVQISAAPGGADYCIGVELLSNGAQVTNKNCTQFNPSSTPPFYNKWDISPGNNQGVRLSGLPAGSGDFCLDSGGQSGSYPSAKIWTCYPGLPAQQ